MKKIPMPQDLCEMARVAERDGFAVKLHCEDAMAIAEHWHADREKIKYLESLIVRMGKA